MNLLSPSRETLLDIAKLYGTPVYVYNARAIEHQITNLQHAFSLFPNKIFYASKALTNINILHLIHKQGLGIDAASINEVRLAVYAGVPKEHILFTASSPTINDIREAISLGVHLHIDTLSVLEKFGEHFGSTKAIGIRINPMLTPSGGTLNISTAHQGSKFGIPISQIPKIVEVVKRYRIKVVGLHQHSGSDVKDAKALLQGMQILSQLLLQFPDVEYLDIGGGFKVPYFESDVEINLNEMAKDICRLHQKMVSDHRKISIWFELGKYVVSQSGYLLTTINAIKSTSQKAFAIVDTGFHHLIRPMFYGAYHHIENLSSQTERQKTYHISGNLCETDDLATERLISELSEGDILAIHNAGAYGFEMSSNFNSHFRPPEVLVTSNGEIQLIRKRDNFQSLLKQQIKTF